MRSVIQIATILPTATALFLAAGATQAQSAQAGVKLANNSAPAAAEPQDAAAPSKQADDQAPAADSNSPPAPAPDAASSGANDKLAEVVVTGSRVIKNGNASPTPVTVINVQDMAVVQPGTVADQLNDLPQFARPPRAAAVVPITMQP